MAQPIELVQLLQDIAIASNEATTFESALQLALDSICAYTGWPVGHVYLLKEQDPNELIPSNIWHLDEPDRYQNFCEITKNTSFISGCGLVGQVFATGEPVWMMDVTENPDFARSKSTEDIEVKSAFAFPVWSRKEVVAVLEFFSNKATAPDRAVLEVMVQVGTQLGRVIERNQAEKVLRESEAKFRALMQAVPESIIVTNSQGKITLWNRGAQNTFGYAEEEMLGQPLTHLMPKRYRAAYQRGIERFLTTGQSNFLGKTLELYGLKKDGSEFELELSLATWKSGGEIFFSGIIRDITKRKMAERQLEEHKEQLAEAQAIANLGSWLWDISTNSLHWSDELYHIYGIDPQSFKASYEAFLERVHDNDRNFVRKVIEEAYDNPQPFSFEHRIVRPDGSVRILQGRGRVTTDESGRPIKMYGTGQDITDRIQAQEALRESEARFRAIFEGTANGIALKDLDMRIIESNPALQNMIGYTKEELRQMPFTDFTHPDDIQINIEFFQNLIAGTRDGYQIEKRYIHKNQDIIWVRITVSMVRNPEGVPLFATAIIEDITKRKQIEAELVEVRRRLMESREAERLHLAQELHDGPLQDLHAMSYHLGEIETIVQNDEQGLSQLTAAQATIQQVIRKLRTMCGELRPPTLAPFGLEKAIRSHTEQFQKTHPELNMQLDLVSDGQLLPEQMRFALFRIYQEALNNIIRHARASNITVKFAMNTEHVVLEIQDDGRGFEVPERQIELARQGHLGLVGATERAEAIGGHLKIISTPGQGSQIRVIVPQPQTPEGEHDQI